MGRLSFRSALSLLIAILFLTFGTISVSAQYYMNVFQNDGQKFHFVVSNLDSINFTSQEEAPYEYVDLGLSVNWATTNVGAASPEKFGNYYSWGETELKDNYSYTTYRWLNNDVAKAQMGGNWRMPTKGEFEELLRYCTWTWTNQKGVNGYKVTGKKVGYVENSIFLPAAGYCNGTIVNNAGSRCSYWSNSINTGNSNSAWCLDGDSCKVSDRFMGLTVRPVSPSVTWQGITSIALDKSNLTIIKGDSDTLMASLKSGVDDYSFLIDKITWSSSNQSVATVDANGVVTALNMGKTTIEAICNSLQASCAVEVLEYVDMGLSVKWATCNVGAEKPEDYGGYYAWGETEPQSDYDWSTYKYCEGLYGTLTKYNNSSSYGTIDNKITLEMRDDVVRQKWGGNWRMPTQTEFDELFNNCTWDWTAQNGVVGYKVTSNISGYTDRSIFLPAAGYRDGTHIVNVGSRGYYWSSSLWTAYSLDAWNLQFSSRDNGIGTNYTSDRYCGLSVRPVYPLETWEAETVVSIELDNNKTMFVGEKSKQAITLLMRNGQECSDLSGYQIMWSSSDQSIASIDADGVVTALSAGKITITAFLGFLQANCEINIVEPEYVDLGLSVKWATFNVGAKVPEDYGYYYAWGEIESKSTYNWSTYKYCDGSQTTLTKYCNDSSYGNNGFTDTLTILDISDDVAHVKWGGNWRIPTKEEYTELIDSCTWTWTTHNGVVGYMVTSNRTGYTDRSVFLPAAGRNNTSGLNSSGVRGNYWTNTLYEDKIPNVAWYLDFNESKRLTGDAKPRYVGCTIRPVYPKDLSSPELTWLTQKRANIARFCYPHPRSDAKGLFNNASL